MFEESTKNNIKFMDFGFFPGDLRQRSSFTDLGFNGFPLTSSVSNGFHFSGDRTTTNPFLNLRKLDTTSLMADGVDMGLCQNLAKMSISDERSNFFNHSSFSGYGCYQGRESSFHGEASSSMRGFVGYGDVHRFEQDLRVRASFHGESAMSSYVGDGSDYHRLRFLALQEASNPNPRCFTENMSLLNRDYMLELEHFNQQIQRDFSLVPQKSPLAFHEERILPPFSAMGGSRELDGSAKCMKNKKDSLDLASMVDSYGSVYLMAKDQLGCRLLQKFVDEGNFVDVMIIFKEVINNVIELGTDPFGNYLIQKLNEVCNEEQRTQILIRLTSKPGLLVKISINNYGTRVVQKLIETVTTKEQISLVKSALVPGFLSLFRELNGNHVILNCLKFFSPNDNKFILEAATKFCIEIATTRHGCCVLQRCVSYSVGEQHEKLVDEISRNSLLLAQDPFGNYLVQYIIEKKVGGVNVLFELRGNYVKLATQKFGSHVVEKCLRYYPESRSQIVNELVSVPNFGYLLQDPYANYVIQCALSKTKGFVRASLVEKVRRYENLKMSPYCKRIFSKNLWKK
ncbi:unnamed protein product [Arabidopsis thaliana]|uniref:(thale cress) hypothetical protein n=1 Tax=Arabidopsis thaliana TaxID=3702 RepID=A0A7G2EYD3_ARATH|nr:unnamed protein product [Arabidopsis thaliana]